ncbi:MAG: ABC transporter substrate-binding protein [Bacilli bacterium]
MKKIIFGLFIIIIIILVSLGFLLKNKDNNLKKVTVAEVAHSVFYAPQYVAHSLGYFTDEGLDVDIILTPGADKVSAAVLSGDVNIGFSGSEVTIYVYNQGEKDYLVTFAGLTKKDGSFLVSREKIKDFKIEDLKDKYIIAGRQGGMPAMTLQWALNQNNIKTTDVTFDTSIAFAAMSGAFIGGTGDYVSLFEPAALQLEKQGYGHVVASVGELGGTVPYTAYHTKKSYAKENPDVLKGFTKATQRGLDFVHENNSRTIADAIIDYFPDTSTNDLIAIIDRYKKIDSWYNTTYIKENDFNHIQTIMKNANELDKTAPYDKLVNNSYSIK